VPDVLYDGLVAPNAQGTRAGNAADLCVGSTTSFANLHADQRDPQTGAFTHISTEAAPYACSLPALPAVTFDGL
jgi:hypothetical protein